MATEEQISAARAKLALGTKPKDIVEMTGVKYQKVLQLKKQMELGVSQVDDLVSLDPIALDVLVEKAKEEAPARIVKKLEVIHEGLTGLQLLDTQFHTTMSLVLGKAEEFIAREDLKPSEWVAITNALSTAYSNIFNNKGVSVNVNNGTQFSDSKLSMFKGSMRG